MIKAHLLTALCITSGLIYSANSQAATAANVYSISSAAVVGDSIQASTITRGFSANHTLYRAMSQTVPKALFLSTFRKALGVTPYGIAALVAYEAYGYFYDNDPASPTFGGMVSLTQSPLPTATGTCRMYLNGGAGYPAYGLTFSECGAYLYNVSRGTPQEGVADNQNWYYSGGRMRTDGAYVGSNQYLEFYGFSGGVQDEKTALTDQEFWDAQIAWMNDSPDMSWADSFYNADGTVNQEYFPNPNFSVNTVADLELMDQYGSGLLQSEDPNLDYYVTPAELARIKDLYDEANKTDEQKAEELTAEIDQPITKAQHLENQIAAETRAANEQANAIKSLTGLDIKASEHGDSATTTWEGFTTMLDNIGGLPEAEFTSYFNFTSSSGCQTVDLPYGFGVFPTVSQCDKLGSLKEMLGYFLAMLVAWNIITTVLKEAN